MKVLICGSHWHDNLLALAGNGFKSLGCKVVTFNDGENDWRQTASKIFMRTPFRKLAANLEENRRRMTGKNFALAVTRSRPDLVLVLGGLRIQQRALMAARERTKAKFACFVVDDPDSAGRTLLYDLGGYDDLFVIDRSWMAPMEFFNPGKVHYLPHAGDSLNFKPLHLKRDIDFAFGGGMALRMPNAPSGYVRAQILNALAEKGFSITLYGLGIKETFKEFPALKNINYVDAYTGHEALNELYNRAKITLGINSPQLKSGVAPRIFDAALSGSFQISDHKADIMELFPGNSVPTFRNIPELLDLARYYLDNEEARMDAAMEARNHALAHHTFTARAKTILETCHMQ